MAITDIEPTCSPLAARSSPLDARGLQLQPIGSHQQTPAPTVH